MGRQAIDLITASDDFEVVARLGSSSDLAEMLTADVVVDFTVPAVSPEIVDFAVSHGLNVLVGTSGWSGDRLAGLGRRLAALPEVGVIVVPNFSVGSVLGTAFAAMASRFYGSIEIIEAHQSGKVDSPSGTAVRTAELMGEARAELGPVAAPHADQRARGQQVASIPIHSLRMDGLIAKQDVVLGGTGETLTISHTTYSPSSYAMGIMLALRALRDARGLTVGLDKLIDLGMPSAAPAPAETFVE